MCNKRYPRLFRFYETFQGYNDWEKKKKKAATLSYESLKRHASAVWSPCSKPYASCWQFVLDLEELVESIDSYASFLKTSNEVQVRNQSLSHPVRQIKDHIYIHYIPACATVAEAYRKSKTWSLMKLMSIHLYFSMWKNTCKISLITVTRHIVISRK